MGREHWPDYPTLRAIAEGLARELTLDNRRGTEVKARASGPGYRVHLFLGICTARLVATAVIEPRCVRLLLDRSHDDDELVFDRTVELEYEDPNWVDLAVRLMTGCTTNNITPNPPAPGI